MGIGKLRRGYSARLPGGASILIAISTEKPNELTAERVSSPENVAPSQGDRQPIPLYPPRARPGNYSFRSPLSKNAPPRRLRLSVPQITFPIMAISKQPLVIAHHLMWTLYGWWLPNDPRGSTSQTIRNDLVAELGDLHRGRRQLQPAGHEISVFYEHAALLLEHPLLEFSPREFSIVADALGEAIRECGHTCYAGAIMPDHVHLVIRKHRDFGEAMIEKIQTLSRERLVQVGLREKGHPTWTRGGWKVFLDHPEEVRRTINYVENNPVKRRLTMQRWSWTTTYDDWPLHPGHSPNSPYVRALRAAGRYPR